MDLYEQSKKCRELYERANMALPEPLQRFLGMNGAGHGASVPGRSAVYIPPPQKPNRPEEATSDWIWVNVKDATPTTTALAILRAANEPVRHREIVERVTELLPTVPKGSISNIGTRLGGGLIERTKQGWR